MEAWAIGRFDLGLHEAEFWALDVRAWRALVARWRDAEKRQDFRSGMLLALVANALTSEKRKPFTPADFYASLVEPKPRQTPAEQAALLREFFKSQNRFAARRGRRKAMEPSKEK